MRCKGKPGHETGSFTYMTGFLVLAAIISTAVAPLAAAPRAKSVFQTGSPWNPAFDLRSDAAIVYGAYNNFGKRLKSWRSHDYNVQFMTGIAWGNYQDYFTGKFDGKTHIDDGQVDSSGNIIWHGRDVPYVVPSKSYLNYIKSQIRKVIDNRISTIYLEEPEFWARSGYSLAFKKEWKEYYGFSWEPEYKSADATYLASKLKFHLFYNALEDAFRFAKEYGRRRGIRVKCFVATHSLLNYSSWEIVSPEASLASIPYIDGYVAQVWSNTAEVPNFYDGVEKSRAFETAFLEYGSMESMTAPTGRKVYFLSDPVGDGISTWADYKKSYEQTFAAELMYPQVDNYEVMPWPERIFLGKYRLADHKTKERIPSSYATQILVMVNSLNSIPLTRNRVDGTQGIGVLLGNSLMFQRFPTHKGYSDPKLSNFYGMALPLLMRGIPLTLVSMENLGYPATLRGMKVLVMSYADMKPLSPNVHKYLAAWVKKGGVLLYYGKDDDPFQRVTEWWDTGNYRYTAASGELFHLMGISPKAGNGKYPYGRGTVFVVREDPKQLVLTRGGDRSFVRLVKHAYEDVAHAGHFRTKNYFFIRRGPYDIAAVMKESVDTSSLIIKGPVIDLFNPSLPVLSDKIVHPGEQAYLYDIGRLKHRIAPLVLCAASRVYHQTMSAREYSFVTAGPAGTNDVMRILLPSSPVGVVISDNQGNRLHQVKTNWDAKSRTLLLQFKNNPDGVNVIIKW